MIERMILFHKNKLTGEEKKIDCVYAINKTDGSESETYVLRFFDNKYQQFFGRESTEDFFPLVDEEFNFENEREMMGMVPLHWRFDE